MSTKRDDRAVSNTTPTTPEEWIEFAKRVQDEQQSQAKLDEAEQSKVHNEQLRAKEQRQAKYAQLGITFDRDGVPRYANGPVIGRARAGG